MDDALYFLMCVFVSLSLSDGSSYMYSCLYPLQYHWSAYDFCANNVTFVTIYNSVKYIEITLFNNV